MIISSVIDLFMVLIRASMSGFEFVGLPMQYINSLQTILVYGIWVVGLDIMSLFAVTIVGWWSIKLTVGLLVWLWELLPLT